MLTGCFGDQHAAMATVAGETPILGVLPLDPAEPIPQGLADRKLDRRADLIAIAMRLETDGTLRLCFVPIEVKHHGVPSCPEPMPTASDAELGRARQQLAQTATLVRDIAMALSFPPAPDGAATAAPSRGNADSRALSRRTTCYRER